MARAAAGVLGALLLAACTRSSGSVGDAPGVPVGAVPKTIGLGGETAWLQTMAGGSGDTTRAVAAIPGGRVLASGVQLRADGMNATILLAVDAAGVVAWSRSFVPPCGLELRPLGAVRSGALALLARTECDAEVPGLGDEVVPRSGALVLLDPEGRSLRRVATPPGAVVAATLDGSGAFVLLIQASPVDSIAVALTEDGQELWRSDAAGVTRIAAAPGGGVLLASSAPRQRLVRIGADGTPSWTVELPATFDLVDVAVLADGAIAALGSLPVSTAWGKGVAGGSSNYSLLSVEPDGTRRTALDVPDAVLSIVAPTLAPLPHGRVLLAGFGGCQLLRGLTPQLEMVWNRELDGACHASAVSAAVTDAGQVVVGGELVGRSDFGAGFVAEASGPHDAFILGLWP
jgi:hypothetical protein